jgi:ubiquinone/menaquinone biosynthesis C-methylase UbiE
MIMSEESSEPQLAPDQVPQGWSELADVYERMFQTFTSQFAREALKQLDIQAGERVLDVATGTGSFSLPAAMQGADVLATDFAAGMIARLRERIDEHALENIRTEVMDGQALEIADGTFDVSASVVGLIFFPDIEKGMTELRRVLKPAGRCAVVCWGEPETFEMFGYLGKALQQAAPDFEMPQQTPVWARLAGHESLHDEMSRAGFNDVKVTTMQGELVVTSPEDYWKEFISSSPPMKILYNKIGEERWQRAGEVFTELLLEKSQGGSCTLTAEACIGIGVAP